MTFHQLPPGSTESSRDTNRLSQYPINLCEQETEP